MPQRDTRLVWQTRLGPLLQPASALWAWGHTWRRHAYRHGWFHQIGISVPVISVGSLQAGGAGKTPFVAHLARRLAGRRIAVLSRGYGGRYRKSRLVPPDADAADVGDEPLLLARRTRAQVWVARDRARLAATLAPRCDVVLLDDGYQHLRLRRRLNICLVTADAWNVTLPAGLWRECPSALRDADYVIGTESLPDWLTRHYTGPTAEVRLVPGAWESSGGEVQPPGRVLAFCGIARPSRFFLTLGDFQVTETCAYPDHHRFTVLELEALWAQARRTGAEALVTTAKDAVRLVHAPSTLPLFWRDVEIAWHSGEPAFAHRLAQALAGD